MDKISEDLEGVAGQHISKILYWHVNKLRGSSQSRLVLVKDSNEATISDKERVKEIWAEILENVLNRDRVARKDTEENENVCDNLDVKEHLFCDEELATILKGLKNYMVPGANSVVNEFLKYDGPEVRNRLLNIMCKMLKKGEVFSNFRKTLMKPL